jgi:DNA invertase Pin-like site-specific DNA recombinase
MPPSFDPQRVFSYIRFSKDRGRAESAGIASHSFQIRESLRMAGITIPSENMLFEVMSGRRNDRPVLNRIIEMIRHDEIDILAVRQDRLSRDTEMTLQLSKLFEIKKSFKLFEIVRGFISFDDPNAWAEFMRAGINAEQEARIDSQRQKLQKKFMRSQGLIQGSVPFGYSRSVDGRCVPNLSEWDIAIDAIDILLRSRGTVQALRSIKEKYGDAFRFASLPGFVDWLQSPTLRGHTPYSRGAEMLFGTHEPLVSPSLAHKIDGFLDRVREQHGIRKATNHAIYSLSGLCVCGRCGAPCHCRTVRRSDKIYRYIDCARPLNNKGCGGSNHRAGIRKGKGRVSTLYAVAEDAVIAALIIKAAEIAEVGSRTIEFQESPEAVKLRSEISQLRSTAKSVTGLEGIIAQKEAHLQNLLEGGLELAGYQNETRFKLGAYAADPDFWKERSPLELQRLFGEFVERVVVDVARVEVVLRV